MPNKTAIQWTDYTSNPLRYRDAQGRDVWACVRVSPGCAHCYAATLARRYGRGGAFTADEMAGLEPYLDDRELRRLLRSKALDGRRVFVCDMTDCFGEWVSDSLLDRLFAVFALRPDVTFQVLTKRPERMLRYLTDESPCGPWEGAPPASRASRIGWAAQDALGEARMIDEFMPDWPLPNVWLGVSCEYQRQADARIPLLLETPAVVRFLSCEPLLGPLDLRRYLPRHVCEHCTGQVALDDQERQGSREEGANIRGAAKCPDADRLPAVPLHAGTVPVDVASHGSSEPVDQLARRAVDRQLRAVGAIRMPDPLQVPFPVEEASQIPKDGRVVGHGDALGLEDAGALPSPRDSRISDGAPDRSLANAVPMGDFLEDATSTVLRADGLPCLCSCHSLHDLHYITWCIAGGESAGPKERRLTSCRTCRGSGRDMGLGYPGTYPPNWKGRPCSRCEGTGQQGLPWLRSLRNQCQAAGVPFFLKQIGGATPKSGGRELDGRTWDEMPHSAREDER